jgi:NAD(P)-dependent dehydrogenase (short-subunit alcohol dehydrogenase family)
MNELIPRELADQVAIVTGSSQGVGKAIALSLAARGAHLALVGRNTAPLRDLADAIERGGSRTAVVRCDVTNGDDVRRMRAEVEAAFAGRIDILVNVVGGTRSLGAAIWEISEADFAEIVTLNLTTAFLTMAAILPKLIERRQGRIINIGGTFGLRGRAGRAAYSAAKWGLRGLTKSAALEVAAYNITVNCVCPGMVDGPQFDRAGEELAARAGISAAEAKDRIAQSYPTQRVSTAQDIADVVCFLASQRGRQITGQDLAVDGGWSL